MCKGSPQQNRDFCPKDSANRDSSRWLPSHRSRPIYYDSRSAEIAGTDGRSEGSRLMLSRCFSGRAVVVASLWTALFMAGTQASANKDEPAPSGKANRLAKETSPYLKLHAHNPVDWFPWGPE